MNLVVRRRCVLRMGDVRASRVDVRAHDFTARVQPMKRGERARVKDEKTSGEDRGHAGVEAGPDPVAFVERLRGNEHALAWRVAKDERGAHVAIAGAGRASRIALAPEDADDRDALAV